MSTQNRINANLWQIANVNGNNQPTGIKVILSGSVDPTAASSLYPALYVNTTSSKMFYNTTGAANAWVQTTVTFPPTPASSSQVFVAFGSTGGI